MHYKSRTPERNETPMESSRPSRKRFAKMLKFLRELNDAMAQNELPQESSVAIELIQNYEQEKIPAKDKDKERLAGALGTHPTAFLAINPRNHVSSEVNDGVSVVAQLLFQIAGSYDLRPVYDEGNGNISYELAGDGDYTEYDLAERMELTEAGGTVERLESTCELTQDDFTEAADASIFTVCGHEQGKRTPNDEQRTAIAKAPGVPPKALIAFDSTNSNEAFHYLMERTHVYYSYRRWASPARLSQTIEASSRLGYPSDRALTSYFTTGISPGLNSRRPETPRSTRAGKTITRDKNDSNQ